MTRKFENGKPWYRDKFRRTLLDMHIEDWNDEFLSKFDPDDYFEKLKLANIASPMIYVQSHVGLCYWPTKSGYMHRAFRGREDAMKRLFEKCRAAGMPTVLYYSLIFNNRAYRDHPEWRMRDLDGHSSRDGGARYGTLCPNSEAYRAFVSEQIQEFSDYFDYDGVFFDMPFWTCVCYCENCRARWAREVGGEMPTVVDWKDERWLLLQRKRTEWMNEFAMFATQTAKRLKPGTTVEHQWGNSMTNWMYGTDQGITLASDYVGTDLYGGVLEQSFACKAWYNMSQNQPFQYMTSRCYPALSEHTTTKTLDMLRQCAMLTYMHHGASLFIDAIDPAGGTDRAVYERIGQVFRETQPYEKYLGRGKMSGEAALYYKVNCRMDVDSPRQVSNAAAFLRDKGSIPLPHRNAIMGAAAALRAEHAPFTVVNNYREELLKDAPVLVVSDAAAMSQKEEEVLEQYAKNGGKLYLSGRSAPGLVQRAFGVQYAGRTKSHIAYVAPTRVQSPLSDYFSTAYPMAILENVELYEGVPRGETLGTVTLPYTDHSIGWQLFVPAGEQGVGDNFDDRFASIHSDPPGIPTNHPALMRVRYGAGEIVYSAAVIERAQRPQHSRIFTQLIRQLRGGEFSFSAKADEMVEFIRFDDAQRQEVLIGAIDLNERFNAAVQDDVRIFMRVERAPRQVLLLPEEKELSFAYKDGKLEVGLGTLNLYAMLLVRF